MQETTPKVEVVQHSPVLPGLPEAQCVDLLIVMHIFPPFLGGVFFCSFYVCALVN